MSINVVADGKKYKVLVDYGMNGAFTYNDPEQANKEAKNLQAKHYPHATVTLI